MDMKRFKDVFSIDSRAIGIFRICLASILIIDLIVRSFSLIAHYTDFGTLPLNFYFNTYQDTGWFSVHLLNGSILFQSILFVIAGLFAVTLLLGYKTRISAIISWILLISIHSRNPTILQGGDIMLRVLLFWAMFIPLNIRYSIDRKLGNVNNNKNVFSFGTAGILLQVAFVYFFSALLKTGNDWIPDGTAIYYALQLDQFATHFGKFMLNFPSLLIGMTYSVYFLELIGPFLILLPFKKIRITTAFAFIITLIGMALCLNLAHFPFVGMMGVLLFLPSLFWDKLSIEFKFLRTRDTHETNYNKSNWKKITVNLIALFFIIYIFLWNVQSLEKLNAIPDNFEFVAHGLRIDQYWNMFSPYPLKDDGWYVINGTLDDGNSVDLMTGKAVNYEKPAHVASLYTNERWRKYLMNLWDRSYAHHRPYYLSYLCYNWNKQNDTKLEHVTMNFMLERSLPDYQPQPVEKVMLEEIDC